MAQYQTLFRWLDPSWEILECQTAPGETSNDCSAVIEVQIPKSLFSLGIHDRLRNTPYQNGFSIQVKFTRASYNLRSNEAPNPNMSVEEYLSPGMGSGGQYSGWLSLVNTKIKANMLNCTINHKGTFNQNKNRVLGYFLFSDCQNNNQNQICPFPFNMKYSKAINRFNINEPVPVHLVNRDSELHNVSTTESTQQFVTPIAGQIQYAHLGSLMPSGYTNTCEIDFVGNFLIPIIIIELDDNHQIPLPDYMLYDLIMEAAGMNIYSQAYASFESMSGGKIKKKRRKSKSKKKKTKRRRRIKRKTRRYHY